jgi:hypothetical protein
MGTHLISLACSHVQFEMSACFGDEVRLHSHKSLSIWAISGDESD